MPERHGEIEEVPLQPFVPTDVIAGPGPAAPRDDLVAGPAWSLPGVDQWRRRWMGLGQSPGLAGRLVRLVRLRAVRTVLLAAALLLSAGFYVLASRSTVTVHAVYAEELTSAPVIVTPCAVSDNCLSTRTVADELVRSVGQDFSGVEIRSVASVFDARVPEVDLQQVVAVLPDATTIVLTEDRNTPTPSRPDMDVRTKVVGGVLIARQRGDWVLSVQLTPAPSETLDSASIVAARTWLRTSALPR